jgi:4-amino-4-deoxy-L-arabinose transferase-like glycosyltransferase
MTGPAAATRDRLVSWLVSRRDLLLAPLVFGLALDAVAERPGRDPARWDEQIYVNVTQNVLDGRWLFPLHSAAGHPIGVMDPFLHKPPLVYWLFAGAVKLTGQPLAGPRLLSALATASIAAVTLLLGARLRDTPTGLLAGWLVADMQALDWDHSGNQIVTDPFLVVFALAAIYLFVVATESTGRDQVTSALAAGVFGGLAVLSKGVAAGPIALACLPLAAVSARRLSRAGWLAVVGAAVAVAAPWFLVVAFHYPVELWEQMVRRQALVRALGKDFIDRPGTFAFMNFPYFRRAPDYFGVTWWALPAAAVLAAVRWRRGSLPRRFTAVCWGLAVGIVGFYAAFGNQIWYILPAVPALALLASDLAVSTARVAVGRAFDERRRTRAVPASGHVSDPDRSD